MGPLSEFVRHLLAHPLPSGAEIVDDGEEPGGYIDDTFLLEPGDEGYQEGMNRSHEPYHLKTEKEVAVILAAGAKDSRRGTPESRAIERAERRKARRW